MLALVHIFRLVTVAISQGPPNSKDSLKYLLRLTTSLLLTFLSLFWILMTSNEGTNPDITITKILRSDENFINDFCAKIIKALVNIR